MNLAPVLRQEDEYSNLRATIDRLDPDGFPELAWIHRASKRIKSKRKRLGIFSGSFNPLTVAHVKMIEDSQAQFGLEEILLCLAKSNVDKSVFGFSLADRLLMLKIYAVQRDDFSVAACSHGRFVDKLSAIKTTYPPRTSFHFITGIDTLIRLFDSKYYTDMHAELKSLFDQCDFITANREEYSADTIRRFLSTPEVGRYACNIKVIELPTDYAAISSTDIREQLERGAPVENLVPSAIFDYIKSTRASSSNEN
ncbi:MAG: nicotinate-nicotinamide nucleotide adenylyltransferase [Candidatus Poribacteria bacterium]|nr:nicotinate-nicotinamide nucleotide adenylyltransferase [Candidatus Poribacteria bacterium]MDE0503105.1 nicotinate-nicotinamide nucleotide adenylyltransferase [Candidatus Poribacteria bacterium]